MPKVYFSPSDQVGNTYAWGATNEGTQMRELANLCYWAAIRCGIDAKYGIGGMKAQTAESNLWGANLHVPLHSNAFNGSVMGTRLFCSKFGGNGHKACKAIFDYLAPITPGTSENIKESPGLYEVKTADAPTAYVECEFHDAPTGARWIIENKPLIAEAIVRGICDYFGTEYVDPHGEIKPEELPPQPETPEPPQPEAPENVPTPEVQPEQHPQPAPIQKLVRLSAGTPIYKTPPESTDTITMSGAYTVVDECNGYGLLKAYAKNRDGWVKMD